MLSDNGGFTLTHPILSNGPADATGSCTTINEDAVISDQRGAQRPEQNCSIGAFELNAVINDDGDNIDNNNDNNDNGANNGGCSLGSFYPSSQAGNILTILALVTPALIRFFKRIS